MLDQVVSVEGDVPSDAIASKSCVRVRIRVEYNQSENWPSGSFAYPLINLASTIAILFRDPWWFPGDREEWVE